MASRARPRGSRNPNFVYLIIGALVVIAIFGYQLYRERHNTTGIEINVGERGVSIQKKVVRYFQDGGLDRAPPDEGRSGTSKKPSVQSVPNQGR
jgi:hypothetical protein